MEKRIRPSVKERGRVKRQDEKVIDEVKIGAVTYLVVESTGAVPCDVCHIRPCSSKPEGLEPCPCFKNKYGKNIYYRKLMHK